MGIFDKGVQKTKVSFFQKLSRAVVGKSKVDDDTLDAIEEALVASDMGVDTTLKIIDNLEERVGRDKYMSFEELVDILRDEISKLLDVDGDDAPVQPFDFSKKPYVIMVVGVNGVGKTTTIGKLASTLKAQGKKVVIGAADTFRAAAVDQLQIWAERAGVDIVKQGMGADPASVAYDTVSAAVARDADVVLIDTAGRLHNRIDLMNELTKIRNVMRKVIPDAPHEVLLVLDASTGQNAYQQAKEFSKATDVTALAITKLDGSAKGGVVIGSLIPMRAAEETFLIVNVPIGEVGTQFHIGKIFLCGFGEAGCEVVGFRAAFACIDTPSGRLCPLVAIAESVGVD